MEYLVLTFVLGHGYDGSVVGYLAWLVKGWRGKYHISSKKYFKKNMCSNMKYCWNLLVGNVECQIQKCIGLALNAASGADVPFSFILWSLVAF